MSGGAREQLRLVLVVIVLSSAPGLVASAWAQCTVSVTPMSFGNYNVYQATATESTGTMTVSCGIAVLVQVQMNRGQHASSFFPRQMASGAERLNYNLYFDAAHTQVWGDGSSTTVTWGILIPLLSSRQHAVFGQIPALQNAAVGSYTDIVVVTVIF